MNWTIIYKTNMYLESPFYYSINLFIHRSLKTYTENLTNTRNTINPLKFTISHPSNPSPIVPKRGKVLLTETF